ncbi:hypothetical protein G6F35_018364 [Rhizopus arrhizus]|nr:hypothetical protein G6F35_018364 [Rhizopus arrhizus]
MIYPSWPEVPITLGLAAERETEAAEETDGEDEEANCASKVAIFDFKDAFSVRRAESSAMTLACVETSC